MKQILHYLLSIVIINSVYAGVTTCDQCSDSFDACNGPIRTMMCTGRDACITFRGKRSANGETQEDFTERRCADSAEFLGSTKGSMNSCVNSSTYVLPEASSYRYSGQWCICDVEDNCNEPKVTLISPAATVPTTKRKVQTTAATVLQTMAPKTTTVARPEKKTNVAAIVVPIVIILLVIIALCVAHFVFGG